jgi:hypothetical protein
MFSSKNGTQLVKVETCAGYSYDTDLKIEDYEEIIGVYGKEGAGSIAQLGFLIWTPPKI